MSIATIFLSIFTYISNIGSNININSESISNFIPEPVINAFTNTKLFMYQSGSTLYSTFITGDIIQILKVFIGLPIVVFLFYGYIFFVLIIVLVTGFINTINDFIDMIRNKIFPTSNS
jgi:hypothetical protein